MRIWKLMDPPLLPLTELFAPRFVHSTTAIKIYHLPYSVHSQEQLLIDKLVPLYENVFHD